MASRKAKRNRETSGSGSADSHAKTGAGSDHAWSSGIPSRPESLAPELPRTTWAYLDSHPLRRFGEWLRRFALGLCLALIAVRFLWTSDSPARLSNDLSVQMQMSGSWWSLACLLTLLVAVCGFALRGELWMRWGWPDAWITVLVILVGLSAREGMDHRSALNLSWEWLGMWFLYLMLRALPRNRAESVGIACVLFAMTCSIAGYGLYQAFVEFPQIKREYRANPEKALMSVGIDPRNAAAAKLFEDRLLGSREPYATYALANSLAGVLAGSAIFGVAVLVCTLRLPKPRVGAVILQIPILAVIFGCLILTKSRSAYIGVAASLSVLALISLRVMPRREIVRFGAGTCAFLTVLVLIGIATRQLDREIVTQASKSLAYRWDYWSVTWKLIQDPNHPGRFWRGVGPGNFSNPYLEHKSELSSEDISDPHNMLLEAWSTAGIFAALTLAGALISAVWATARKTAAPDTESDTDITSPIPATRSDWERLPPLPPAHVGWMPAMGMLSWGLVLIFDPMPAEAQSLTRWVLLGFGYLFTIALGLSSWRLGVITAAGCGLAVFAMSVNLLAAGGIGFLSVSAALWAWVALGLNLRDDQPIGRPRRLGGFAAVGAVALVWSAFAGLQYAALVPFWNSERLLTQAHSELNSSKPDYRRIEALCLEATAADQYNPRPFLIHAESLLHQWRANKYEPDKEIWVKVMALYDKALESPRDYHNVNILRTKAQLARDFLAKLDNTLSPTDILRLREQEIRATRQAGLLYPTNAQLHAELAFASQEIGLVEDAVKEAEIALHLDEVTPHLSHKLPDKLREALKSALPAWIEQVAEVERATTQKPKTSPKSANPNP